MSDDPVRKLLELYPKIFLACHTRHVRDPKSKKKLSAHQAGILDHLDDAEPVALVELAKHMGVTPGTMSIAIDRLVELGFVLKSRDRNDARRVRLKLSAAGSRIKAAQSVLDRELVEAMLGYLSPEEREEGLRGLEILARAARAMQHERSGQGAWNRRGRSKSSNDNGDES